MKNILLFTVLIGLGFTGGSLFPNIMADAENSITEENCNCGCGPAEVKVMMMPAGSDMLLTTSLIEAISNDEDNTLTQEELVTIINQVQKEYTETNEYSNVQGASIAYPQSETNSTFYSYEEIISRFLAGNLTTNSALSQREAYTNTNIEQSEPVSRENSIMFNQANTESSNTKKTKNNNGLGNGSESADGTTNDTKGIDPSNPGNKQKKSSKSVTNTTRTTEVKSSSTTTNSSSSKSKEKKDKEKNNNGLGNGSETADGTSTDIKGEDPSNPGNGGSKNKAGGK